MNKIQKTAVLYHYPCPDGAFAALAANLYFSHCSTTAAALFFPNTVYSPLRVEDLPLNEINRVYLLDFVGPPGFIKKLSSKVEQIVVLDHHKTALEMLGSGASVSGNVINVIDMKRSGATIAYDYFKEKLLHGDINSGKDGNQEGVQVFDRVRRLFEYIEDSDLWRWHLPNSKAFSSGLKDLNLEFNARLNPSLFQQLLSLDLESLIRQGMESLSYKQRLIDEVLEQSYEIALGGGAYGRCLAVDADSISELRSELGNQLANKSHKRNLRGIGAVVYRVPELENDDLLKISLRSIDNEDTTPISQYLCRNTEVGGIEMLVHSC
ncbi:uncharacterized protein LOC111376683 isoform X2 [Olea europaea var. sylvestris]|uniref:uncharacterized protein LOC111376683 isoform X2 n=1 Tax=Olea europaea var. sylvestris TaxID=158386 RepID=UPI000C1D527E|nr:uncharacterized protein LOC111376683 isoform X2 [Olea europaea var. sylvestris]